MVGVSTREWVTVKPAATGISVELKGLLAWISGGWVVFLVDASLKNSQCFSSRKTVWP